MLAHNFGVDNHSYIHNKSLIPPLNNHLCQIVGSICKSLGWWVQLYRPYICTIFEHHATIAIHIKILASVILFTLYLWSVFENQHSQISNKLTASGLRTYQTLHNTSPHSIKIPQLANSNRELCSSKINQSTYTLCTNFVCSISYIHYTITHTKSFVHKFSCVVALEADAPCRTRPFPLHRSVVCAQRSELSWPSVLQRSLSV